MKGEEGKRDKGGAPQPVRCAAAAALAGLLLQLRWHWQLPLRIIAAWFSGCLTASPAPQKVPRP